MTNENIVEKTEKEVEKMGNENNPYANMDYDQLMSEKTTLDLIIEKNLPKRTRLRMQHMERAKVLGIKAAAYNAHMRDFTANLKKSEAETDYGMTKFPNQPLELRSGPYETGADGISRNGKFITNTAYIPQMLIKDVITNDTKVSIAIYRDGVWDSEIISKHDFLTPASFSKLANKDLDIFCGNNREATDYNRFMLNNNRDLIPIQPVVPYCCWNPDYSALNPITSDVKVDTYGDKNSICKFITSQGDEEANLNFFSEELQNNIVFRLSVDASLASILLQPLKLQNFIFHVHGTSGTGKTLVSIGASSVWGNPTVGCYAKSLNGTVNSMFQYATDLRILPLVLDELETVKNSKGYHKFVMGISEGVDRSRLGPNGKLTEQGTWKNIVITSGESPLVKPADAEGVYNRVLQIEVDPAHPAIENLATRGAHIYEHLTTNYGMLGKIFTEKIIPAIRNGELRIAYDTNYQAVLANLNTTPKMAANIAVLLSADQYLSNEVLNCTPLTIVDIEPFIKQNEKGENITNVKEFIINFVALHKDQFQVINKIDPDENSKVPANCIGRLTFNKDNTCFVEVVSGKLKAALLAANFDFDTIKSSLAVDGFLLNHRGRYTRYTTIGQIGTYVFDLHYSLEKGNTEEQNVISVPEN